MYIYVCVIQSVNVCPSSFNSSSLDLQLPCMSVKLFFSNPTVSIHSTTNLLRETRLQTAWLLLWEYSLLVVYLMKLMVSLTKSYTKLQLNSSGLSFNLYQHDLYFFSTNSFFQLVTIKYSTWQNQLFHALFVAFILNKLKLMSFCAKQHSSIIKSTHLNSLERQLPQVCFQIIMLYFHGN